MCGLAGFVDSTGRFGESHLVKMTDSMDHRGPDGSGYSVRMVGGCRVALGHRRLAVIDLDRKSVV